MGGSGTGGAEVPSEVLEIMLMEKFNWTPVEIDQIPVRKLHTMLAVLNQRRISEDEAAEIKDKMGEEKSKASQKRRRKR